MGNRPSIYLRSAALCLLFLGKAVWIASEELQPETSEAYSDYVIGQQYAYGQGLPQDYLKSRHFLQLAAEKGYAPAQYNLAVYCQSGVGGPKDKKQAARWFRAAAIQGFADAQVNLAAMYYLGQGAAKNYNEALKWYRAAANQGNAFGMYNVGEFYFSGLCVKRDLPESYKWYFLSSLVSAPRGSSARVIKRAAVSRMKYLEKVMSQDQMARARILVRRAERDSSRRRAVVER